MNIENYKKLTRAITQGDEDTVKSFKDQLNDHPKDCMPLLHYASLYSYGMVKVLLLLGADVNIVDNNGKTALMLNIKKDTFTILVDFGANINLQDKDGRTAIHYAAIRNHDERLNIFLQNRNPDLNIKDNTGQTALMIAVRENNFESVRVLLLYGADFSIKDNNQQTLLQIASLLKDDRIETLLLKAEKAKDISLKKVNKISKTKIFTADNIIDLENQVSEFISKIDPNDIKAYSITNVQYKWITQLIYAE